MATQTLKVNKKDKKEVVKKAKYRRKKDVFGKSLSRVGIFVLIILELVAFGIVKTVFTIKQNNEQKTIETEIKTLDADIAQRTLESRIKQQKIDNIGTLIATLPTSFDKQAVYLDIDRIITLSGLKIDDMVKRTCEETEMMPFETTTTTLKANKINFRVVGQLDDIDAIVKFITYLTEYEHENFYYISSIIYSESRNIDIRSVCTFEIYTFYNDVIIN